MVNSHYVPQFILRNFYNDNKITYCDLEKKTIQPRNARSVFSEDGYYPENIEKDLCVKAEHQFANLFHNKIENARNMLSLTAEELYTIKKYLVVCAIRYKYELSEEDKNRIEALGPAFRVDYDKSLNEILACDKLEDIFKVLGKTEDYLYKAFQGENSGNADDLNMPLWSELKDVLHSYLIFAKARGSEKFLIPDVGRGIYQGPLGIRKTTGLFDNVMQTGNPQLIQLMQLITPRDYTIYPLSKDIMIISMNSFFKLFTDSEFHVNIKMPEDCPTLSAALEFGDRNMITPPKVKMRGTNKEYKYEIKYLSTKDICHFNSLMIGEAERYIACADLGEIQNSINTAFDYTERDLSFMLLDQT